jgi:hypothetical protein
MKDFDQLYQPFEHLSLFHVVCWDGLGVPPLS